MTFSYLKLHRDVVRRHGPHRDVTNIPHILRQYQINYRGRRCVGWDMGGLIREMQQHVTVIDEHITIANVCVECISVRVVSAASPVSVRGIKISSQYDLSGYTKDVFQLHRSEPSGRAIVVAYYYRDTGQLCQNCHSFNVLYCRMMTERSVRYIISQHHGNATVPISPSHLSEW